CRLRSGLGNQLFQYAMARATQLRLGTELRLDLAELLDPYPPAGYVPREYALSDFRLSQQFLVPPTVLHSLYALPAGSRWRRGVRRLARRGYPLHQEPSFRVDLALLRAPVDNVIYRGFWQSERYFQDFAVQIKADLCFRNPLPSTSVQLARRMAAESAVGVHVRRRDTIGDPTHEVTDLGYYLRGMELIRGRYPDCNFYVFSDDVGWCQTHLGAISRLTIIPAEQGGHHFRLLTLCRHFLIPNSTFSWWAAWLGEREDSLVVAPARWFGTDKYDYRDVVPDRWRKLDN
ncbi:MAG: alpha-1,2-fucosyltransferase, partial [Bacteroidota bacterium]